MPRTIGHILECHHLAADRRKRGLPIWAYHANIKPIIAALQDNPTNEQIAEGSRNIGRLLRLSIPAAMLDVCDDKYDSIIEEIIVHLEHAAADDFADDPDYSLRNFLDDILDELYDWADFNRLALD